MYNFYMKWKENGKIEFKLRAPKGNNLQKKVAAFANSEGGKIYFGVDDDGKVKETNKEFNKDKITNLIKDWTPSVDVAKLFKLIKYEIENIDGHNIFVIVVDISNVPISSYDNNKNNLVYYQRIAATVAQTKKDTLLVKLSEINKTSEKYNIDNFTNIMKHISDEYKLTSYGLIKECFLTTLSEMFLNKPKGNLMFFNEKEFNIWEIESLLTQILTSFQKERFLVGSTRNYKINYVGEDLFKQVIRELVTNAIANSIYKSNINIKVSKRGFEISNSVKTRDFITSMDKHSLDHNPVYPWRNKVLHKMKILEGEGIGYHEIIRQSNSQNDFITFAIQEKNILQIKIIFLKLYDDHSISILKNDFPIDYSQTIYDELKCYTDASNGKLKLKKGVIKW